MKLANIQGLRGAAVLLVLIAHFHLLSNYFSIPSNLSVMIPLGNWGVDLFFVISGFIMITVNWSVFGAVDSSKRFLIRRIIRIIPNYWLVTLLMFTVITLAPSVVHNWPTHAHIASSLLLIPDKKGAILFVAWTLVYEMYFYYVFTVLLNFPRRVALVCMGSWAALIFASQFFPFADSNIFLHYYLSNIVLEFLVGVLVGILVIKGVFADPIVSIALGIVGIGLAFAYALHYGTDPWLGGHYRWVFVGIPMGLILYGSVLLEHLRGRTFPAFIQHIGDASYSIYLWHMTLYVLIGKGLLALARHVTVPTPLILLVIPAIICAGVLLYRYVEMPLLRFSNRLASRLFPTLLAAGPRRETLHDAKVGGQLVPIAVQSQSHSETPANPPPQAANISVLERVWLYLRGDSEMI